ncbi:hypothetical protein [Spirochaeta lutea]|uniref:Uncharacterized protein n=1 Tax=Spirochaeta lutea TaxID=1480694 RepID=A0A098QZN3_9SPIO|nr:hypothetical protein [Spirochaeta lutea]KGE73305.1 hypothetical protein DC28_04695 [Spirochaeta lutea]
MDTPIEFQQQMESQRDAIGEWLGEYLARIEWFITRLEENNTKREIMLKNRDRYDRNRKGAPRKDG